MKVVGAGVGKNKQTSGAWKYVIEFEPPVKNRNAKCLVKRKLPAREVVCGHLMKYQRAEKGKKGGGTNGIWRHFKKDHPVEYAAEMALSSHSSEGKKRAAEIFAGER